MDDIKKEELNIGEMNTDDNKLFEAHTELSNDNVKNLSKFIWFKYYRKGYVFVLLWIIALVVSCTYNIILNYTTTGSLSKNSILYSVMIVVSFVFLFMFPRAKMKKDARVLYNYSFYDDRMVISIKSSANSVVEILYSDTSAIKNVCNTKRYVFFMVNKKAGYMLDKNSLPADSEIEFLTYLQHKFAFKYKNYDKYYK